MRAKLILFLLVIIGLAGSVFYFADKAEKSAPAKSEIRMEAANVLGR